MASNYLENRLCLITGANRGIGLALAKALDGQGAKLLLHGRDKKSLEQVRDELGHPEKHSILFADLRHRSGIEKLTSILCDQLPRLDVLIHNAGILGPRAKLEDYPDMAWNEVLEVNLTAPFILTQKLLPILRKGINPSVVFTTSGVGRKGSANWGAYSVSKFGLESMTQIFSDELKEEGININAVNPGATRTAMRAAAYPNEDPTSLPTAEDITPLFIYLSRPDIKLTGKSLDAKEWIGHNPHEMSILPK